MLIFILDDRGTQRVKNKSHRDRHVKRARVDDAFNYHILPSYNYKVMFGGRMRGGVKECRKKKIKNQNTINLFSNNNDIITFVHGHFYNSALQ